MSFITLNTLESGLPLIVERMTGVKSAAILWLIPCGDAFDEPGAIGTAPMLAEMLERGAGGLDSRQIADAFDRAGASKSISNGRIFVRIGGSTIGANAAEALTLLTSIVRTPRFDAGDVEPARELCLQSLASLADDPQQRATIAARRRHRASPLNRSGYGTEEGLRGLDRASLASAWASRALPKGSILSVAGDVDPDAILAQVVRETDGWAGETPGYTTGDAPTRGYEHEDDDSEQVQVIAVHDAPKETDDASVLERLLTGVLSGGMSSRLFAEVREKRGLCYAVSAGYAADRDFGATTAYVGTTPDRAQEALDVLFGELSAIGGAKPIDVGEFERARIGLKSRLIFSGESTTARAGALASHFYRVGRPRLLDEQIRAIDAVTLDELNAYAASRDLGRVTIQTLGPKSVTPPAGATA